MDQLLAHVQSSRFDGAKLTGCLWQPKAVAHHCHDIKSAMREFRLLRHNSGAYEILPVGWSFGALIFHVFWAIGNGLFLRCIYLFTPYLLFSAIGMFLLYVQKYEDMAGLCMQLSGLLGIASVIYFSAVAFDWRADLLMKKGYEEIATIYGRTGQQALNKWALSDDADRVLDNS